MHLTTFKIHQNRKMPVVLALLVVPATSRQIKLYIHGSESALHLEVNRLKQTRSFKTKWSVYSISTQIFDRQEEIPKIPAKTFIYSLITEYLYVSISPDIHVFEILFTCQTAPPTAAASRSSSIFSHLSVATVRYRWTKE